MLPRKFIAQVLIEEIRDVIPHHPYLAFPLIGIGIEYLGRALDLDKPWDYDYNPGRRPQDRPVPFDRAITTLFPADYHNKDLRNLMRNGLLHFYRPKPELALARLKDPGIPRTITRASHPYRDTSGTVILVVEYLHADFVEACHKVSNTRFPRANKMSRNFVRTDVPVRK